MKISEVLLTTDIKYSPATAIRAGELNAIYEEGRIRYISHGDEEVIRMIYPALRAADWTTIYCTISNEKIVVNEKSFTISYWASYQSGDIQYKAEYELQGTEDSRIIFTMRGEALNDFLSKRIGFCLLHGAEDCAGKQITITQPDGSKYESQFPEMVAPRQPFKNVRGMEWQIDNQSRIYVTLEGDVFETEDQRNYGDISFKTYSGVTEVREPFQVHAGNITEQKITIQLFPAHSTDTIKHHLSELKFPMPKIGYRRSKHQLLLTEKEISLLKEIPFDHYAINIILSDPNWKSEFSNGITEAIKLDVKIIIDVTFNEKTEQETESFIEYISRSANHILSILILTEGTATCPKDFFNMAAQKIKNSLPQILTGYGTQGHYVDLNRARPEDLNCDFVSYHSLPQAHLNDSRTIIENLRNGPAVIQTANYFSGNKPIFVSVSFSKNIPDQRLHSWLGAWFTLGSICYLAEAERISFYELKGEMGILNGDEPSPVFKALRALKEFNPSYVLLNTGDDIFFEDKNNGKLVFKSDFQQLKS